MSAPRPSGEEMRRFAQHMAPAWDEIRLLLCAERPPDWYGVEFEARIEHAGEGEFSVVCRYADRSSNRLRNVPQLVVDKLAALFVTCRNFSDISEWKRFRISQIWSEEAREWSTEMKWEYRISADEG